MKNRTTFPIVIQVRGEMFLRRCLLKLSSADMRRFGRWPVRLIFLLLLTGAGWGGWYGYNKGFSRTWREYVIAEFRKRGVEVSFRRLAIDPFAGLVARDVVIVDAKDPDKVLASINHIVLDINYGNLIHRQPFLNAIDLRDANLSLPVNPADPKSKIKVSHLNARVLLPPHQIVLAHAEAMFYGTHISATGRLINPEAFQPSAPASEEAAKKRAAIVETIVDELKKLRFDSTPSLEVRFSGDLAEPESIFAEATLTGEKMKRGGYRIKRAKVALNYRDGVVTLKEGTIHDQQGALDVSGSFETGGKGEFRARSSLDVAAFLAEFGFTKRLDEIVFHSPPVIELSGKIEQGQELTLAVVGSVALQDFSLRAVVFDAATAHFSWDGTRWYVSDVRVANRTGELSASALNTPDGFRLKLHSTINPKSFLPLLSGHEAEFLSAWEFDQSPEVRFNLHGPSANFDGCEGDGEIRLGRSRLRGVPLLSAVSKVRIKNKTVSYDDFKIERAEGTATGSVLYDIARHEVRLEKIRAKLNPADVIVWINPDLLNAVTPYRFKKAPNASVNGVVQFAGGKKTNLEIAVDAPEGMDYVFLKKTLSAPKISAKLLFTDERLRISNLDGTLMAGRLRGDADISFSKRNPNYSAGLAVEHVDFEKLTSLYFNYKDSKGELAGDYRWRGRGPDARNMEGRGTATVTNGNVFAIPMLGPLSGLMNEVIPGAGYNTARRASADFEIADGVIRTRDFLVQGNGFSMMGGGDLFFLDDKMNFRVRMNAQGIPGVVLFPVSKLLEYVSDGSLGKPSWRPVVLPRGLGGTPKSAKENPDTGGPR